MTKADELIGRERVLAAYDAFSDVLAYLNTLETRAVEKKEIYAAVMAMRPREVSPLGLLTTPRYITEWSEDDGQCLWWHFPVEEAPYVGSPLDTDFDEHWHTWWTPLPDARLVASAFEAIRLRNTEARSLQSKGPTE